MIECIANLCSTLDGVATVTVEAWHVPEHPKFLDGPSPMFGPRNAFAVHVAGEQTDQQFRWVRIVPLHMAEGAPAWRSLGAAITHDIKAMPNP